MVEERVCVQIIHAVMMKYIILYSL